MLKNKEYSINQISDGDIPEIIVTAPNVEEAIRAYVFKRERFVNEILRIEDLSANNVSYVRASGQILASLEFKHVEQ